jgi:hypothetical protein
MLSKWVEVLVPPPSLGFTIARAGPNQIARLVLFKGVRDPSDRSTEGKECGRTSDWKREGTCDGDQTDIDRRPTEASPAHRIDKREDRLDFGARTPEAARDFDEQGSARIRMGRIDWVGESFDHFAAPLPIMHDLFDSIRRSGFE